MRKAIAGVLLLGGLAGVLYGSGTGNTYLAALSTIPLVLGLAWFGERMR